ncbi:MAG TPA: FHA domain-containing protein, partial [Polyangiaceae bacterium]|nr:FHA domain-containing protein [Polyangiaceae bacterium]
MIPGFGKASILIGSAPHCDIRLGAPGVAPEHAHLEHRGGGTLVFVDHAVGPSFANGAPLAPGATAPFDFHTEFAVGQGAVPKAHPAITLMLLERGKAPFTPGQLVFGRDPARANIAIHHPNVSSHHATFQLNPLTVTDHNSTSGTWLNQQRLPPNQPQPLDPRAFVALGPVAVPVDLVLHLAGLFAAPGPAAGPGAPQPPTAVAAQFPGEPAAPGPDRASNPTPRPKHKTVVGQIQMAQASQGQKSIGRTPENDIQIPHPQVSSRHAVLHVQGGQLFIEDKGSANGTYVRGQRIPANQRVPVANGEKVLIGPMPLLLQVAGGEVAVVVEDAAHWEGRPLYEIEAWDLLMQVPDRDNPGELKTLLDHVSFKALPGDLIALMGPSGAGKTTLLLTLNGYLPPSGGQVRINGEDLYAIYDALRGSIGYVPQDDIVHPELTVWEA